MAEAQRSTRRDAENRAGCMVRLIFLIIGVGLVLGALASLAPSVLQFGKVLPTPKPAAPAAPSQP